jgi:hypothetical protein
VGRPLSHHDYLATLRVHGDLLEPMPPYPDAARIGCQNARASLGITKHLKGAEEGSETKATFSGMGHRAEKVSERQ